MIVPAIGVRQRYYGPFARALAEAGFEVLTWDWRGTGSSPTAPTGSATDLTTWANQDLEAALSWATEQSWSRPIVAIAHSFGGQVLGLARHASVLSTIVTVAAPIGYWRLWRRPYRYALAVLWLAIVPIVTRISGKFPARLLGLGQNIPKGAALQWARWCRSSDYLADWSGHATLSAPMLALSFAGDLYAPQQAVDALHQHYTNALVTRVHVDPYKFQRPHFALFRCAAEDDLWPAVINWVVRRTTFYGPSARPDSAGPLHDFRH